MKGSNDNRPYRSPIASAFDAMTLVVAAVMLGVAACSALALGPAEAVDRIGCGLNELVNGLLAYPRPCR